MMQFGHVLKEARKRSGLSTLKLEALTGIDHSLLTAYEVNRRRPHYENLEKLATTLKIPIETFFGKHSVSEIQTGSVPCTRVPVYTSANYLVDCFRTPPYEQKINTYIDIPKSLIPISVIAAARVADDSMSPTLNKNDIVIFREASHIEEGHIVLSPIPVKPAGFLIGRMHYPPYPDDQTLLYFDNPKYPPSLRKVKPELYPVIARFNRFL